MTKTLKTAAKTFATTTIAVAGAIALIGLANDPSLVNLSLSLVTGWNIGKIISWIWF